MNKVSVGPQTLLFPMPAVLVGTEVEGQSNFMTAAWCGIVNSEPPMISVAVRPQRYTLAGIKGGAFSINVPSISLTKETDFCGIISGRKGDKAAICGFTVFEGKVRGAPMVRECPVNLECAVVHQLALGTHVLFIGEIKEVYVTEECLTDGKPDVEKVRPLVFTPGLRPSYYALGECLAPAFKIGLELKMPASDGGDR